MAAKYIPVAEPEIDEEELENVINALKDRAISGLFGSYIGRFEQEFATYVACRYGVGVSSGTAAIHLALAALDIGPGDEVLVAAYTNMATFFPVHYIGAKPVPVDVEGDTWNIDPGKVRQNISDRTRAIIVVHIFGHPVDMDPIMDIAKQFGLYVIEDCAEAHGALYKGQPVGSIGTMGCFSFYANKIISTGEGGMVTTNDERLAKRVSSLKSLAYGTSERFMHEEIGYNYRLSNIHAAIGCAQLTKISRIIEGKQKLASAYNRRLGGCAFLQLPTEKEYAKNVYWMYHVVLKSTRRKSRTQVMQALYERGVETRPGFVPYNMQRYFIEKGLTSPDICPVAAGLSNTAFYLPSSHRLTEADVEFVTEHLLEILAA